MPKLLGGALALLLVAAVATGSVTAVDAWRAAAERPRPCPPARGELQGDADLLTRAWRALTDRRAEALGDLDGSEFALARSCVLYAGRFGGAGDPRVVVVEETVAGYRVLVRIGELQVPERGDPVRATSGTVELIGSALERGVVLPLSGAYLVGDVAATGVRVRTARDGFAAAVPAGDLGSGVFDLGVAVDRTVAPARRGEHVAALIEVERVGGLPPLPALVPVLPPLMVGDPVRPVVEIEAADGAVADLDRLAPVFALLTTDPDLTGAFDRGVLPTALEVRTAPIPDGMRVEVTVRDPAGASQAPFAYAVRDGVARKEDHE
ncbi:MAG TPA: hypothetical protein VKZ81_27140 [Pseudonocardia sp.]|uniref:hypothetical protein n=1 Tax=Pseudonocardia sp. TaxID=60912 RepID=UPI002B4AED6A|nr:hypothetical protein [Pseudonocardia sp.]HLU59154.1 hypothetical protein [Pseudonocardia sp.]